MLSAGSSSYKENEESYPLSAGQGSPYGVGSLGASRNRKLNTTRYYIIKSLNHHNIQLSIEKGIWATQVMNEPILEEAFHVRLPLLAIYHVKDTILMFMNLRVVIAFLAEFQ